MCSDSQAATGHEDNCGSSNNGELFLLYRHLKKYKVYHAINGKTSGTNRKKGIKIPQDFTGESLEFLSPRRMHLKVESLT